MDPQILISTLHTEGAQHNGVALQCALMTFYYQLFSF